MPRSGGGGFEQELQRPSGGGFRLTPDRGQPRTWSTAPSTPSKSSRCSSAWRSCRRSWDNPDKLLGDAGFYSAANVEHCERRGIIPYIARRRDQHYVPWYDRSALPEPLPADATPVQRMAHRLKTPEGRALYGLRKQLPEPVFGIIKHAMRFRQFLLRGLREDDRRMATGGVGLQLPPPARAQGVVGHTFFFGSNESTTVTNSSPIGVQSDRLLGSRDQLADV